MKRNILDKINAIPTSVNVIDKTTLYNYSGTDENKIKIGVMNQIRKKQPHNIKKRKFIIAVIAACLAISFIGTGVFAVMGGLDKAFGEIITGSTDTETLYPGDDVIINNSDENLDISVLGITGNDTTAYVSLELKNRDGSKIVSDENSRVGIYSETVFGINTEEKHSDFGYEQIKDYFSISVEGKENNENKENLYYGLSGYGGWESVKKDLSDTSDNLMENKFIKSVVSDNGKTIKLYIKYIRNNESPQGKVMNVQCRGLSEYKDGSILRTYDSNYIGEPYDDVKTNFYDKGIGGRWINNSDGSLSFIETFNQKLDINFDISLKLKYNSTGKRININGNEAINIMSDNQVKNVEIALSSFGINLTADHAVFDGSSLTSSDLFEIDKNKVIMKDGKEYGMIGIIEASKKNTSFINI